MWYQTRNRATQNQRLKRDSRYGADVLFTKRSERWEMLKRFGEDVHRTTRASRPQEPSNTLLIWMQYQPGPEGGSPAAVAQ